MKKKKMLTIGYLAGVLIFLILAVGPFVWSFILSLTPEYEMFKNSPDFLPTHVVMDHYRQLFDFSSRKSSRFFSGMLNSVKAVLVTLSLGLPVGALSAYVLSRFRFPGRKVIRDLLLMTMAVPVFATVIPLYRIFSGYGLLDRIFWLSAVYVTSFLPTTTWLLISYFNTIPRELDEAAMVDGCGKMEVFFRIFLPISVPVLFSAGLLIFLSVWGQYQIPLILASSNATKPVAIVASEFMTKDSIQYGLTSAAGLVAVLPPMAAAITFRRFLIQGMTGGAVKG